MLYGIIYFIAFIIIIKSITLGSNFSFIVWFIHGKKYYKWYFERQLKWKEEFLEYLKSLEVEKNERK